TLHERLVAGVELEGHPHSLGAIPPHLREVARKVAAVPDRLTERSRLDLDTQSAAGAGSEIRRVDRLEHLGEQLGAERPPLAVGAAEAGEIPGVGPEPPPAPLE